MRLVVNVEFSVKDIVDIAKSRQEIKKDVVQFFSGSRGSGKSTLNYKFCKRFPCFKEWDHIVYSRNEIMSLMESSKRQVIMDDEAIRTGYARNFYEGDQKLLIQIFNMYRNNENVYSGCIPFFLNLDIDLRNLGTLWIHLIKRGIGIVNMPLENPYIRDRWDTENNRKIVSEALNSQRRNPHFEVPWHRLSTFAGYIYFEALTPLQEELYQKIKETKRKKVYDTEMNKDQSKSDMFYDNVIGMIKKGNLNSEKLQAIAVANGISYVAIRTKLNRMLIDDGGRQRLGDFLNKPTNKELITNNHIAEKLPFRRLVKA